jgi:glutamate N-acetyltransferase/amino-acid N-acetyltransferase
MAKGSGMIHPDMATLLCFLTTDAGVDVDFLRKALREAVDVSFHMVSIDRDTSTNDTVLIMANGLSGSGGVAPGGRQAEVFQQALNHACIYLAREIARDGEGATRLIEVNVSGAASEADARRAAKTIAGSSLVKAAVHGSDPNWGRVIMAAGYSGARLAADKLELDIGGICLVKNGSPLAFSREEVVRVLDSPEVYITLNLNVGRAEATAWGCDLSEEYVTINSVYTT